MHRVGGKGGGGYCLQLLLFSPLFQTATHERFIVFLTNSSGICSHFTVTCHIIGGKKTATL